MNKNNPTEKQADKNVTGKPFETSPGQKQTQNPTRSEEHKRNADQEKSRATQTTH